MRRRIGSSAVIAMYLFSQSGFAADSKEREFEYPELLVSPSASDRLAGEAKTENKERWSTHATIQVPALTTLLAGIMAGGDPGSHSAKDGEVKPIKTASLMAMSVGGLWLVGTGVMSATYSPYQKGVNFLKSLPQGSKKDKLAYERYAEESLAGPAHIASILRWASMISNLGANAMIMGNASKSETKILGSMGLLTSFVPIFFDHPWNEVNNVHNTYKKRIYGPLTSTEFSILPNGKGEMAGVVQWAMVF